jgi:N-acetylneuraminic acid mutarotase
MLQPVVQAAAVKLADDRVLVAGGFPASDNPQISVYCQIYDPTSNTWTAAAPLSQPRYAHLLALRPDGQVLAIGGAWEYDYPGSRPWTNASFIRAIERYAPLSDRWTIAGELPQPLAYAASAWLPDGRLWLTGGNDASGATANTWLITPLPAQP